MIPLNVQISEQISHSVALTQTQKNRGVKAAGRTGGSGSGAAASHSPVPGSQGRHLSLSLFSSLSQLTYLPTTYALKTLPNAATGINFQRTSAGQAGIRKPTASHRSPASLDARPAARYQAENEYRQLATRLTIYILCS